MTVREDLTIDWSVSPRIIEVTAPSVELTVQDLYDTLRTLASEAIAEPEIVDGSGKEVLSATELVGLTMKLFNAKVKFEDRTSPTDCEIYGGNLVAVDGNGQPMNPIQNALNVTVSYAKSSSAMLVVGAWGEIEKEDLIASVEILEERIGIPTSPSIADDLDEIWEKAKNLPSDPVSVSALENALRVIRQLIESVQPSVPKIKV